MRVRNNLIVVISIIFFCIAISGCLSTQSPGKGTINLTSTPPGAEVYLDNQYRGSTPSTITDLPPGIYTVELRSQGYQSWSTSIAVSSGSYQLNALLTPVSQPTVQPSQGISQQTTPPASQTKVTIQASKDPMIIGDSITFSGICIGSNSVLLTLYGPGYYSKGVLLDQPKPNSVGLWSYTWNPGTSLQSGSYTMVVYDAKKISSDGIAFSVVGGGEVVISANSYSAAKGDTLIFSGRCTTGAQNVLLVLYGPERFSSGAELGTISVMADNTWSFKYTIDSTMPTGIYSIYVYDVPKTTSGTMQFTVGFAS